VCQSNDTGDDDAIIRLGAEAVNERAIDLEHLDREVAQRPERRIAGPEVINRQRHTELLKFAQDGTRPDFVGHHDRLGDLQVQATRRKPCFAQHSCDLVSQAGFLELAAGEVDAHTDVTGSRPTILPGAQLATGLVQRPGSDRNDQPRLFGNRSVTLPR